MLQVPTMQRCLLFFLFVIFIDAYSSKSIASLQCSSLLGSSNDTANDAIEKVLENLESKIVKLYGEQPLPRTTVILLQNLHEVSINLIDRVLNDEALSLAETNLIHTISSKLDLSSNLNSNESEKGFEFLNDIMLNQEITSLMMLQKK